MSGRVPIDPILLKTYQNSSIARCVEMYRATGVQQSCFPRCILRSVIGVKAIYGDKARMDSKKTDNIPNTKADKSILALHDSLPWEHCVELYRIQHDNLNRRTRFALRAMIGAKVIYGENYGKPPVK